MNVPSKLFRIVIGLVVACVVVGAIVLRLTDPLQFKAPSDEDLIAVFQTHRADFERLRQMAVEDLHVKSYLSESELNGISPEARRQEYRSRLKSWPGLHVGVNYDESVRFIFADGGRLAVGPGWAKGIEFSPQGKKLIGQRVNTLNNERMLPAGVYLKELIPEWFILYQRDD